MNKYSEYSLITNEFRDSIKNEFKILLAKKGGNPNNWLETLTITNDNEIDKTLNIDDDIKSLLDNFFDINLFNTSRIGNF